MSKCKEPFFRIAIPSVIILVALSGPVRAEDGRDQTLALGEAIQRVLERAPEAAIARAEVEKAGAAIRETRALNLPLVTTGTGLAYNNGFPLSIEGAAPSIFQVGVSKPVFNRKLRSLSLQAEAGSRAAEVGSEQARNELTARTALLYCELHQARKLEAIANARLESAREAERVVETMLAAGRVRPLDEEMARAVSAAADQQLLTVQEQARLAESELRELIGLDEATRIITVEPEFRPELFQEPVERLVEKGLQSHPEVRRAEAELQASEYHLDAERAGRYPTLDLIGEYALFSRANNYQDYFNKFTRNNFLVGVSIQVPVFDGHRSSARVAQSREEVSAAGARLARMRLEIRMTIERAASALRVALGAARLAHQEVNVANGNLDVNRTLSEAGRLGPKEMAESRGRLEDREAAALEADRLVFACRIELLRATGTIADAF